MPTKYDVLEQAEALVTDHIELLQALYDVKKMRMDAQSRLMCRCPSCRDEQQATLDWLAALRDHDAPVS